jgi:hypothetical protein
VHQAGELLLQALNGRGESLQVSDLEVGLLLVDVNDLELVLIALGTSLKNSKRVIYKTSLFDIL